MIGEASRKLCRIVHVTTIIGLYGMVVVSPTKSDETNMTKTKRTDEGPALQQGRRRPREELQPLADRLYKDIALMEQLRAAIGSRNKEKMQAVMYDITRALAAIDPSIGIYEGAQMTIILADKLGVGHVGSRGADDVVSD
jgi:hypothetical protein